MKKRAKIQLRSHTAVIGCLVEIHLLLAKLRALSTDLSLETKLIKLILNSHAMFISQRDSLYGDDSFRLD